MPELQIMRESQRKMQGTKTSAGDSYKPPILDFRGDDERRNIRHVTLLVNMSEHDSTSPPGGG